LQITLGASSKSGRKKTTARESNVAKQTLCDVAHSALLLHCAKGPPYLHVASRIVECDRKELKESKLTTYSGFWCNAVCENGFHRPTVGSELQFHRRPGIRTPCRRGLAARPPGPDYILPDAEQLSQLHAEDYVFRARQSQGTLLEIVTSIDERLKEAGDIVARLSYVEETCALVNVHDQRTLRDPGTFS
jgi:hypothetical protein